MSEYKVLSIFFKDNDDLLKDLPANVMIEYIKDEKVVKDLIDPETPTLFAKEALLVLFCPVVESIGINEFAQMISYKYPEVPIFFVARDRNQIIDRAALKKNGFSDVFIYPFDAPLIRTQIKTAMEKAGGEKKISYFPVNLLDLVPGSIVDFDIYIFLPGNKKYVKFVGSGGLLDEKRYQRLKENESNLMFIPRSEVNTFNKYCAANLSSTSNNKALSETERQTKVESTLRNFIGKVFDETRESDSHIDQGKMLFDSLRGIVSEFILIGEGGDWYKKMMTNIGGFSDPYSHASRVSTLAALFSMALGEGQPEELAIAGLVHDMGLGAIPQDVLGRPEKEWTREDRKIYEAHPEFSLRVLKERRMVIPEEVEKAVLYHHRKWNGSGYPSGNSNHSKGPTVQILTIADEFEYLTTMESGKKKISPAEAFALMIEKGENNPLYLKKLQRLFKSESEEKKA